MTDVKTNFFTEIEKLLIEDGMRLTLSFSKVGGKIMTRVVPEYPKADLTADRIHGLTLTHPAQALDESFFSSIIKPAVDAIEPIGGQIQKMVEQMDKATKPKGGSAPKKKAAPAKKAAPKKPEKSKAQIEKEKKEADKKKKVTELLSKANENIKANQPSLASSNLKEAKKLATDVAQVDEIEKLIKEVDGLLIKAKLTPVLEKAKAFVKGKKFEPAGHAIKEAIAIDLESSKEDLKVLAAQMVDDIGESVTKLLIGDGYDSLK